MNEKQVRRITEKRLMELEKKNEQLQKERWIVDDAGTLIDMVTRETYDIVEEVVDVLNYYENNCERYLQTINELKDGTYKEPLPIIQRK